MTENNNIKDESVQKQIIQAAQHLFQIHGIQKVTMDDVAREIGKRRSSLYYYYKNKEEILDAAIDVEMREILREITQAIDQQHDFAKKIHAYCMTRLMISQKRRVLHHIIDSGMNETEVSDYKEVRAIMHQRFRQLEVPLLMQILNFGIEKGQLRKMNQKEQDNVIFILLSSLQGLKKEMTLKNSLDAVTPAVEMLVYLLMKGFGK